MTVGLHDLLVKIEEPDHTGDPGNPVYAEEKIRELATKVVNLGDPAHGPGATGLLAIREDDTTVDVALFQWASSNSDMTENKYELLMHGRGFGGALRELRHTYWGEGDNSGYIFYPPGKLISQAMAALEEWFDL